MYLKIKYRDQFSSTSCSVNMSTLGNMHFQIEISQEFNAKNLVSKVSRKTENPSKCATKSDIDRHRFLSVGSDR